MKAKKSKDQKVLTIVKDPQVSLKTLTQNYANYLLTFMRMRFDPLSHTKLIDGQVYLSKGAKELGLHLDQDLELSRERMEDLFKKNIVCNKSLILHFKMIHLYACYADFFGKRHNAFQLFSSAYEFIKIYGERLYREEDPEFHEQIYLLIVFFCTLSSTDEEDTEVIKLIENEVMPDLIAFTVKICGYQYSTNLTNYIRTLALKKPLSKSEQLKLGLEIETNFNYSSNLIASLNENGHYCNDFMLLHLLIMFLHAEFANHIEAKEESILSYLNVFYFLKANISILDFESNFAFQDQIYRLFDRLRSLDGIKDIYPELESLEVAFKEKCGISIVVVEKSYEKFMKLLWQSQAPLLNERKDFFSKGTQLNNTYLNLKSTQRLPLEYQLYSLAINYYMLNLSIATQPRRLLNVLYVDKTTLYFINKSKLNAEALNSFLGTWSYLKKLYIEPTLALIRGFDMNDFVNINSLRYCLNFLKYWSSLNSAVLCLIKTLIDREYQNLQQVHKINDKEQQEIMKLIFKLQPEIQDLMKTTALIGKVDREINAKIGVKELKDTVTIPSQLKNMKVKSKKLDSKINNLKTKLENLNKQSLKSQDELINAEKQQKTRQLVKKKQRILIPIQKYTVEDISSDEDITTEEEQHCPIDPNLTMLQAVDIELTKRVKQLKPELSKFLGYLEERLKYKVPLPGDEQTKTFDCITELTLQSFELEQLFSQYNLLAQLGEIKSLREQQQGIKINQGEHDRAINDIAAELVRLKNLFDKVNVKHKEGKLNKIYEYGLEKIKLQNINFDINECEFEQRKLLDSNMGIYEYHLEQENSLSKDHIYKRIMKLGRAEFNRVGEEKRSKGEQLSQYSFQNEFLGSVDIIFTSLDYLHDKLKANSLISNQHSFFNLDKKKKICTGRFEGAIGLLYKYKYQLTGDFNCLYISTTHLDKSFNYYQKRINSECILADLSYNLALVKDLLVSHDSENSNLKTEILVHYREALEFDAQLESSRFEEKTLLEIGARIEALENNSRSLVLIS
ncbi:MAG: hypothetical protein H0U57_03325 [Tatlockia sp.]|nr:hypothetical protein [Tatlockia sp.]